MYSRLRERLGTPGLIAAVAALVLVLAGGAYAASGGLTAVQKKQVIKIAKKYAGKNGIPGAQGPQGNPGTNGKDGAAGEKGDPGTNGTNGTNGKNVVTGTEATGTLHCGGNGGATVEVEGEPSTKEYACNGTTGFTETLPANETETGSYFGWAPETESVRVHVSFAIPLATAPTYLKPSEPEYANKCQGNAGSPTAAAGYLCVYPVAGGTLGGSVDPGTGVFGSGAGKTGALIFSNAGAKERFGTFAVTAGP